MSSYEEMISLVVSVFDAASLAYFPPISLPAMPVCPGIQIIDICFGFIKLVLDEDRDVIWVVFVFNVLYSA